ncbi:MAG TPA: ammonium transporter [Blastocatellia bacterium]|nr:ammonium transporter [Blastocatellia bacterium]
MHSLNSRSLVAGTLLSALASTLTLAQTLEEKIAALEKANAAAQAAAAQAQMAGDNAWMLISAALVLMMTGPGLALFYGGLVRRKNVLATMMQSFIMMAVITIIWGVFGYSLAFAKGTPFIGGFGHLFLQGVGSEPSVYAGTIPHLTFMVYQLMFAIITPALISGAFAERMKFSGMLVFCSLWTIVVYIPLAHMIWGDGGFLNATLGGTVPVLDFAGGTVVHISSGCSALVCALYLGKRVGYPKQPFMPHNLVLAVVGACMLWVGWFGFNAGSALASNGTAANAFVTTHFGAAAATVSWLLLEKLRQGKPTVLGGISGAVAGLAGITQTAGFVSPMSALIIGFIAGILCYFAVTEVKKRFGYDDSLDAFGVHGISGFTGAIMAGVFANSAVNAVFKDPNGKVLPSGLLEGNSRQLLNQIIGAVMGAALSMLATYILLVLVDKLVGLRVSGEDEIQGLDLSQHGEEGYNLDLDAITGAGLPGAAVSYGTATVTDHIVGS